MATIPSGNSPRTPSAFPKRAGEEHLRRLRAYEANPEVEMLLRKIIPDIEGGSITSRGLGNNTVNVPDPAYLQQLAGTIGQSTTDATSLMQLLPDLTLVMNLLISAILAPKNLDATELTFTANQQAFHLPIAGRLLEVVSDHFSNVYNIKTLCPDILKEIIFLTGSYALAVIPENAVDAMINGSGSYSTESFAQSLMPMYDSDGTYKSLGLLGAGPSVIPSGGRHSASIESQTDTPDGGFVNAMESLRQFTTPTRPHSPYADSLGPDLAKTVVITDNYNVAKFSALMEAKRVSLEKRAIANSMGLEAGSNTYAGGGAGYANYALGGAQRNRTTFTHAAIVQSIKTNEMLIKPMVGHPLIMRIPSESVIPVFIQPNKHLGYFVLLDAEGNPLRLANRKDIYNDLSTSNNGTASSTQGASQMIQMTQNLSIGVNPRENPKDPAQMVKIYGQLLEHELKARLSNGIYGPNAKLDISGDVYQIMLARSLKKQQTQILYVPGSQMVYMAFDYAENGTGRSITEQTKIIGAMRAMLGFSNVMAGIKNSVSRQRVTLTVSENDPDPYKTVARTMDEYTRRRNVTMPFVASDPADMISYINLAGVEWNIEGKGTPAHKVDIEDKQTNRAKVDVDLDNMLRDRHYMAYGVTPEAVLASTGADFATTVVTNNQMFAKRVIGYQDQFTPFLEQFVKMVTLNSATLMNLLREIVVSSVSDLYRHGDDEKSREDIVDRTKEAKLNEIKAKEADNPYAIPQVEALHQSPQTILTEYTNGAPPAPRQLTVEESKLVDQIVFEFIDAIEISLPRPDTATEESQEKMLDTHASLMDKALSFIVDSAFLGPSNLGEYAGHAEELKAAYKAEFMRSWMRANGVLPELEKITAVDEDGRPELDIQKAVTEHTNLISVGAQAYLADLGKLREQIKQDAAALTNKYPDADITGQGTSGGGAGGFGGGGGYNEGGGYGGEPEMSGGEEGDLGNEEGIDEGGESGGADVGFPEEGAPTEENPEEGTEGAPATPQAPGTPPAIPGQPNPHVLPKKPGEEDEEEEEL